MERPVDWWLPSPLSLRGALATNLMRRCTPLTAAPVEDRISLRSAEARGR